MKKKTNTAFILFFTIVLVLSVGLLITRVIEYREAADIYNEAVALAAVPEETTSAAIEASEEVVDTTPEPVYVNPYADEFANMDFVALKEVNEEVIGWIMIPETKLSYPLLKTDNNDYYLNHAWNGSRNSSGSIFMEYRNSVDFSDFNTIIYGHRMGNDTMFGILKNYKNQAYWEENPMIYIDTESGTYAYYIFAAYETSVTSDTFRIVFKDTNEQQDLINHAVANSIIKTDIIPETNHSILTLSTCLSANINSDLRLVVQAVQVMID